MLRQPTLCGSSLLRGGWLFFLLCLCLPFITGCESRKVVVTGLDEKEANEIYVLLATKGIDVQKVQEAEAGGGAQKAVLWGISVPNENAVEAMAVLNREGLPRRKGQSLLGIFKDVGLVPSEMTEKIRYQAGLAEQIASTIRKIDGVLDAEVQLSFPEEDPLNPGKSKGDITASVYVKHAGVLDDPNLLLVPKIKRLVTGAVTGLRYDNVAVIADRARGSELPVGMQVGKEEEKQYVKTWTIVLAKESVTRFRIIFFGFIFIILFLILSLFWVGWKTFPLLKQYGGVGSLFSLTSFEKREPEEKKEGAEVTAEKAKEEAEEEEEEEEETPPRDVT